jgi:hypothetical protein
MNHVYSVTLIVDVAPGDDPGAIVGDLVDELDDRVRTMRLGRESRVVTFGVKPLPRAYEHTAPEGEHP